jgi:hypothetical protein
MDDALNGLGGKPGVIEAPTGCGGSAEVEVTDVDRLGVRVRRVTVSRAPVGIAQEADALPERLRSLPERVAPFEVSPALGGARLRTVPKEIRGREFFDVDVEVARTTVTRTRITGDGDRESVDWTMTREQLERLVRELDAESE